MAIRVFGLICPIKRGDGNAMARLFISFPVVRMSGEDLLGTVELLEQQAAHQQMRPRHRAERHYRLGAVENFGAETIGAADREGELRYPLVAPRREPVGKPPARPHRAVLVERDQPRPRRQRREDQRRLARLLHRRGQALPHLELDDRNRRHDPRCVERLQLGQLPLAQLADGEEAEADGGPPGYCRATSLSGKASLHSFSRL